MRFREQKDSGLLVPEEKRAAVTKPEPFRGACGLRGARRERVIAALDALWDALDLSSGSGILGSSFQDRQRRYYAFRVFGEYLVGEDCPEKEQKC